MLFVAFWFFTAGVYPFPYFFAIGKSLDPAIMEPILIAIPFSFLILSYRLEKTTST
jgi:hypothetical protein